MEVPWRSHSHLGLSSNTVGSIVSMRRRYEYVRMSAGQLGILGSR